MIVTSAVATTSEAPELRAPIRLARNAARPDSAIATAAPGAIAPSGRGRQMLGWLEDAGLSLLLVLAFPVVILILGAPVALVVRLLIEIGRRLW
jgi:hypothetical protein